MKKMMISLMFAMLALVGCAPNSNLPEGDVKVIQQNLNGIVEILLTSATNNEMTSSIASMILPVNEKYEISLFAEVYEQGELISTEKILSHTTNTLTRDSIFHFILHAGHQGHRSMFAIAETDLESEDMSNPNFIMTSAEYSAMFNSESMYATHIINYGGDLNEEILLAVYISHQDLNSEINLYEIEHYRDRSTLQNYERAVLIKAEITQK